MICKKCWRDAFTRAQSRHKGQSECYEELLKERMGSICSPEQQAGHDALPCVTCRRKTRHEDDPTVCMNPKCEEEGKIVEEIESMSHYNMASLWRNSPAGHVYFDNTRQFADIFKERLFKHFGGITPEISREIGWD